jgi:hypothetical protein
MFPLGAQAAQGFEVARPAAPEPEIRAFHDADRPEGRIHPRDELVRRHGQQLGRRFETPDLIGAGGPQQLGPLRKGREHRRGPLGTEDGERVGVEGQGRHAPRGAEAAGQVAGRASSARWPACTPSKLPTVMTRVPSGIGAG